MDEKTKDYVSIYSNIHLTHENLSNTSRCLRHQSKRLSKIMNAYHTKSITYKELILQLSTIEEVIKANKIKVLITISKKLLLINFIIFFISPTPLTFLLLALW